MSFVPVPQQANAAGANSNNAVKSTDPAAAVEQNDAEFLFKIRTFDSFWVDKKGRSSISSLKITRPHAGLIVTPTLATPELW